MLCLSDLLIPCHLWNWGKKGTFLHCAQKCHWNGFQLPLFPHQTRSWAVEKVWVLHCSSQQGFAATAMRVQEVQIFCQRVCGERLPKVLLSPSLAGQSLGWAGLKLGREPCFPRRSMWCCTFSVPGIQWGQPQPSAQPQSQRSTKTLTWSLTLSQLKGPCGLLSQAELPQHWPSTGLRLCPPPLPLTHPSPYPWESALYHTTCQMLCCWAVLTPILLERADQFSRVTQAVDKAPLRLLTKAQTESVSIASPWVLQATFYYRPWDPEKGETILV